jgi:transcriptional regulator with XRE-family HTH domain
MTPQDSFITRLRRHRERNQVSLDEIVTQTRIKREQLEAFERGDLENWPRGIYARAWVRAYASVVGLDPIDTVDEFCKLFPHGDRRAQPTFREYAAIIAHQSTYRDEFEHLTEEDRRRAPEGYQAPPTPSWRRQMRRLVRSFLSLRPARAPRPVRSVRTN